jgi:UDP-N-acetylglucosamine pyrophosphorylase
MQQSDLFIEFEAKMRAAGVRDTAIRAFKHSYQSLVAGDTGLIPEETIQAITELPRLEQVETETRVQTELLSQVVVVKLNGGLGTSMGLERAKSLLPVKNGLSFLDFIAKQVLHARDQHRQPLRFILMNSYSTSGETREFLLKYPELGRPDQLELMQSQAPKVDAQSLRPVAWPANPQLEWCPPGHGDIYPSLLGSGLLEQWLCEGRKYLFVSNSDNLGASLDLQVLSYFANSGKPFMMEVAERTASDSKGGHLARRGERLLLRESAQCPKADQQFFQDISRHRFFNTNNLWIRLDSLKELVEKHGGFVPLPLIKNQKTVDPRDKNSPAVFQLETAMGAAIQCFENAGALVVPRARFAPVKTTSDLLALRSDAYQITEDWRVVLAVQNGPAPPAIDLDPNHYSLVDQLDEKLADGIPSLKNCQELIVRGPVLFNAGNLFRGKVSITNHSSKPLPLPASTYADCHKELGI